MAPRELLGVFLGFRGRHMRDAGRWAEAEPDYLLARHLFPSNRKLYINATGVSVRQSVKRFERDEEGSPASLAGWLSEDYGSVNPTVPGRSVERKVQLPLPDDLKHYSGPSIIVQAMRGGK